jgi:hypothetical protein
MNENINHKLQTMLNTDEEIRAILLEVYGHGNNVDYNSVVVVAIDCALRLNNVLVNVRRPGEGRNHRATMD